MGFFLGAALQMPFDPPIPSGFLRLVSGLAQDVGDVPDPIHTLSTLRSSQKFVEPTLIDGIDASKYGVVGGNIFGPYLVGFKSQNLGRGASQVWYCDIEPI